MDTLDSIKEGYTFLHIADQYLQDNLKWIGIVKDTQPIDVLFINCWTSNKQEIILRFNSTLVVSGQENELNHSYRP